tara:strand:- start:294 stop:485 length:192 start_codon:yes stop_codon:yes gene_type:complete
MMGLSVERAISLSTGETHDRLVRLMDMFFSIPRGEEPSEEFSKQLRQAIKDAEEQIKDVDGAV